MSGQQSTSTVVNPTSIVNFRRRWNAPSIPVQVQVFAARSVQPFLRGPLLWRMRPDWNLWASKRVGRKIQPRPYSLSKPLSIHLLQALHIARKSRACAQTGSARRVQNMGMSSAITGRNKCRAERRTYRCQARSENAELALPRHPDALASVPSSQYSVLAGH